jgi:hypothetical protein
MADPISTGPLGNDPINSNESDYVAQLGRISGKLLSANLLRNGVDLYFKDTDASDALLHLDVAGDRIGINTDPSAPIYDVDVNSEIKSLNVISNTNLYVDDFTISSSGIFSTNTDIIILPSGPFPQAIFNAFGSQTIVFDDNQIYSINNNDIVFTPDGSGTIELEKDTFVTGNLYSTGTITLNGDLSTIENLIVGNNESEDTLTIFPSLQNDLLPQTNIIYDIGSSSNRWGEFYSERLSLSNSIVISNIRISDPSTIESAVGDINFDLSGNNKNVIFNNGLSTADFLIKDNKITTNLNTDLILEASGTGSIITNNITNFSSNLYVDGKIELTGDLSTTSNIIIGNEPGDVLILNTDLTQDLLPGIDANYDLGKFNRRWKTAYIEDSSKIGNVNSQVITIGNEMQISGISNTITAIVNNSDLVLSSATDIYNIEDIRFQDNDITNLLNTPLMLRSVGIGYYRFQGDNGMVFPAGTDSERPLSPEIGDTRWNTEQGYLECFDGSVYIVSIGPGDQLTVADAEELNTIYSLFLG